MIICVGAAFPLYLNFKLPFRRAKVSDSQQNLFISQWFRFLHMEAIATNPIGFHIAKDYSYCMLYNINNTFSKHFLKKI